MLRRKKSVRHLGYAWWRGCGWAWRGRYICRICYAPRARTDEEFADLIRRYMQRDLP